MTGPSWCGGGGGCSQKPRPPPAARTPVSCSGRNCSVKAFAEPEEVLRLGLAFLDPPPPMFPSSASCLRPLGVNAGPLLLGRRESHPRSSRSAGVSLSGGGALAAPQRQAAEGTGVLAPPPVLGAFQANHQGPHSLLGCEEPGLLGPGEGLLCSQLPLLSCRKLPGSTGLGRPLPDPSFCSREGHTWPPLSLGPPASPRWPQGGPAGGQGWPGFQCPGHQDMSIKSARKAMTVGGTLGPAGGGCSVQRK